MSALPRQMYQTRGKQAGASGSSIANLRRRSFSARTTHATTSASVFAPAASASRINSKLPFVNWGKHGSQPLRTARACLSAVCPPAIGWSSFDTGHISRNARS